MADNGQNVDLLSIEANEVQHDAVLDYYGRRLATCSSDKTIKIFEVEGDKHTLVETLRGYVTTKTPCEDAVDNWTDTKAQYGASHGPIPSTATSSHPPHMTARSSSGASSRPHGRRSTRLPYTLPRSTLSPGRPTKWAAFSHAPLPTATSRCLNSRTMRGHM